MITVADKICYPFSVDTGTVSFPSHSFLIKHALSLVGAFVLFITVASACFSSSEIALIYLKIVLRD